MRRYPPSPTVPFWVAGLMLWVLGAIIAGATISSAAQSGAVLAPGLAAVASVAAGWICRRVGRARASRRGAVTVLVDADHINFHDRTHTASFDRTRLGLLVLHEEPTGGRTNAITHIIAFDADRTELATIATGWTTTLGLRLRYRLRRYAYPTAAVYVTYLGRVSVRPSRRAPPWAREVAAGHH